MGGGGPNCNPNLCRGSWAHVVLGGAAPPRLCGASPRDIWWNIEKGGARFLAALLRSGGVFLTEAGVKAVAFGGDIFEQFGGFEPLPVGGFKVVAYIDGFLRGDHVEP